MPAVQECFRAAKAQFNGEPGGLGGYDTEL